MTERESNPNPPIVGLSAADAARLDARLAGGGDAGPAHGDGRDRQVGRVLALIDQCPAASGEPDLVDRTMSRIRETENRRRLTEQAHMLAGGPGSAGHAGAGGGAWRGPAWRQVATLAACVLIAASLLLPVLSRNQQVARQLACQSGLGRAASAMSMYAADHNQAMPRGKIKPGSEWCRVGQPRGRDGTIKSNSAHLYILIRQHYAEPETLACPGNDRAHPARMSDRHHDWPSAEAVSYSYQNQYTPKPIRLNEHPDLVVLADKNPLFVARLGRVTHDAQRPDISPSRLHAGRGQNVLRADGVVRWTVRPVMDEAGNRGDNIWVIQGVQHYQGNETPRNQDDSFLVP